MISDVLFEARKEIERYQTDETFSDVYSDVNLKVKLEKLKKDMLEIQKELDTPPILERNITITINCSPIIDGDEMIKIIKEALSKPGSV